jgi:hypothetical protein
MFLGFFFSERSRRVFAAAIGFFYVQIKVQYSKCAKRRCSGNLRIVLVLRTNMTVHLASNKMVLGFPTFSLIKEAFLINCLLH